MATPNLFPTTHNPHKPVKWADLFAANEQFSAAVEAAVEQDVTLDVSSFDVDTLNEKTVGHGVIIDGVTAKDGGLTLTSTLTGTVGTFSGAVSGTTGTFSGAVSGTTGTFSSTVSGVAGTFTGAVTSTVAKSDYEKFISFENVLGPSVGTWTVTRIAQADYVLRKTAAAETAIIGMNITEPLRIAASKGFNLASINVVFRNTTDALVAHTATLDKVDYADSAAPVITSIPVTGTLATATDADPQVSSLTVTTPAYNITNNSKYVLEVTANAAATSVYDFIGIVLRFSRNDM